MTMESQSDWRDGGSEAQQAASGPHPELASPPASEFSVLPATPPPHDVTSIEARTGTSGSTHHAELGFTT